MASQNGLVVISLFLPIALGGCAAAPIEQPLATPSPTVSASASPDAEEILVPEVAALRDHLFAAGKAKNIVTSDLSGWFGSTSGYLGGLEAGPNCNIAVFESSQDAFDARLKIGQGQFVSASGSFGNTGALFFASNVIDSCASKGSGVVSFLDEKLTAASNKVWTASSAAIKDCWVNHVDCLEKRKLSVPVEAVDSYSLSEDALAKLVDAGYCVTTNGNPNGWIVPGYLVCNATNGLNVHAAVGSSYVLPRVASVKNGFADSIIAGDGWVLAFDDGFTDREIQGAYQLTGGKLYAH